jgi:hypothetical protein
VACEVIERGKRPWLCQEAEQERDPVTFYGGSVSLGNLFGDWDGRERLLGFLTETNAFFKTTPRRLPEHPDTGDPPGAG